MSVDPPSEDVPFNDAPHTALHTTLLPTCEDPAGYWDSQRFVTIQKIVIHRDVCRKFILAGDT